MFSFVAEYVGYFFVTGGNRYPRLRNCSKLHVNETHISDQRFPAVAFVVQTLVSRLRTASSATHYICIANADYAAGNANIRPSSDHLNAV